MYKRKSRRGRRSTISRKPSTLGDTIRQAREAQALGIRQLARLIDVAPSQVLRWEKNELVPQGERLITLAEQLELRAADLFELAGRAIPDEMKSLPAMLRADYDLPPRAIKEIERHIAAVAKKYHKQSSMGNSKTSTERRETNDQHEQQRQ